MERSAVFQRKGTTLLLAVDLAQFLEELAESVVDLGAQGSVVLADERRIVRLFRRLKTDSHIAVENNLLEAVINLFFQYA